MNFLELDGRRGPARFLRLVLRNEVLAVAFCGGAVLVGWACGSSSNGTTPPPSDGGGTDAPVTTDDASNGGEGGADAGTQPSKAWDWTGIVGTGQSLSVGAHGSPLKEVAQPYNNLKLSLGIGTVPFPPFDANSTVLSMVPLVEPIHGYAMTYPSAYPANINGETPHSAMANQITAMFRAAVDGGDYVTAHTVVGESGQPMYIINKAAMEYDDAGTTTGRAYAATVFEVTAIKRLAAAAGKTYGVGAIVITHGESDTGNQSYEQNLVQLWSDYNADLSAITGQTAKIPMLVSQQHSVPSGPGSASASTQAEWQVGIDHPGDIVCSGPKYQYGYYTDPTNVGDRGVHLMTQGYDELGEKYAEVYYQRVVLGQNWQPLQPVGIDRAGAVITVHFHVPVEPMVWDSTLPMPHATMSQWAAGRGFEVSTLAAPITITQVAISGDDVVITCDHDLTGQYLNVAYAFTTDGNQMPGGTFRWGQLRDSDPFVGSVTNVAQPNYAVAFNKVSQ